MKLRIQETDITLRLLPEEVASLAQQKRLIQITQLADHQLHIEIKLQEINQIELKHRGQVFSFLFPENLIEEWSTTNKVGYRRHDGEVLLVIEKDMPPKRKRDN